MPPFQSNTCRLPVSAISWAPAHKGEITDILSCQIHVLDQGCQRLEFELWGSDFSRRLNMGSERNTALSFPLAIQPSFSAFAGEDTGGSEPR